MSRKRQYVHRLGTKWQLAKYNRKPQQSDESPRELSPQAPSMSQEPGPSSPGAHRTESHQNAQVVVDNSGNHDSRWDAAPYAYQHPASPCPPPQSVPRIGHQAYEYSPVVQPPTLEYELDYAVLPSENYLPASEFLIAPDGGGMRNFQVLLSPPSVPVTYPARQLPR